jgi:hypothetical protein
MARLCAPASSTSVSLAAGLAEAAEDDAATLGSGPPAPAVGAGPPAGLEHEDVATRRRAASETSHLRSPDSRVVIAIVLPSKT